MTIPSEDEQFERLLLYLKHVRGFDFTAYKRTTLQRRVQKRLQTVGASDYTEYIDYLEVHPEEFAHLFNTVLINVTSFFRDEEAWAYLAAEVIPKIVGAQSADEPIRVWVAGCASGEEAYTVAMLLAEALGAEEFRKRVKIYGTDLDEEALAQCRLASYAPKQVEGLAPALIERYFERTNGHLVFDREIRRNVVFGRHDLTQDAPISRVDLLLCRNTLMYFNAESQQRIVARFHFALKDGGFLFLGKAETLLTHANTFLPVDLRHRVFTKIARDRGRRDRLLLLGNGHRDTRVVTTESDRLTEYAFDAAPLAQLVIDTDGRLIGVNARARQVFGLTSRDVGTPFQDLEISYRPAELRSGIEQATRQRRAILQKDVQWASPNGDVSIFDLRIQPLFNDEGESLGTSVVFEDITHYKRLQEELLNFNQELETAYEEVQSTNEELQTTNEELQSTVEELETTNEELQSTNEELETMNEELQSANEELETINEELRKRSFELNKANLFLESILAGLRDGVVVIDQELKILAWNHRSEDLWGLRAHEVMGKHLLNLDIGLPLDSLRAPIRACLVAGEPQELQVRGISRRGKAVECFIAFTPLRSATAEPQGVILIMECKPC